LVPIKHAFLRSVLNRKHDDILLTKNRKTDFHWKDEDVMQKLSPNTIIKYRYKDEKGAYRFERRFLKGSPIKGAKDVDQKWRFEHPELVVRLSQAGDATDDSFFIPIENQSSPTAAGYPTQNPQHF